MRGYLDDLVTIIPFWILRSSVGSPSMFQSPTVCSSTRNYCSIRSSELGIFFSLRSLMKYSAVSMFLNSALKGPQ